MISRQYGRVSGGAIIATLLAAGVCIALFVYINSGRVCPAHITVASSTLCVLVAETDADIERGLGGRSALRDYDGMLFMFPKDGEYAFWMKDMRFGLDIVWIRADGTVVGIEHNVRPESYPKTFAPPESVRMVLEVAAGTAPEVWVGSVVTYLRAE